MKLTRSRRSLSLIVCIVLTAALALFTTGCNGSNPPSAPDSGLTQLEGGELGQGATQFTFTVTDGEGKDTVFQIHTDQSTVGEALLELGLIAGDEGPYGLYVKTVNGITADYDRDGVFWAFYEGDASAMRGVDQTEITPGGSYAFKVE